MKEDLPTKDLFCERPRCQRFLGKIVDDGALFEVGNMQLFNSFRASCKCGKPFIFHTRPFSVDGFKDNDEMATRKILNQLGKRIVGRPPRVADNLED